MTKNTVLKGLAITTVFLSALPALAYLAFYWKSIKNETNVISKQELYPFIVIALIASTAHLGVTAAQSAVEIGGAFFMVSAFIHMTKIAALIMLYFACKTDTEDAHQDKMTQA